MYRSLLVRVLYISSLFALTPAHALTPPPRSDLEERIEEIWVLLNHQDFAQATKLTRSTLDMYDTSTIAWELSYEDFVSLLQAINIDRNEYITEKSELISRRAEWYPDEVDNCAFVTRTHGYSTPCETPSASSTYIDHVDHAFRLLFGHHQKSVARKIRMLERSARTLQDYNDLGNLMGWYVSTYPQYEQAIAPKMGRLGWLIIQKDPHWVNGYLLLTRIKPDDSAYQAGICKSMQEHYHGDQERAEMVLSSCQQ